MKDVSLEILKIRRKAAWLDTCNLINTDVSNIEKLHNKWIKVNLEYFKALKGSN